MSNEVMDYLFESYDFESDGEEVIDSIIKDINSDRFSEDDLGEFINMVVYIENINKRILDRVSEVYSSIVVE